jgi:hypothetical protein
MMGRVIVVLVCGWLLAGPVPSRAGERPAPRSEAALTDPGPSPDSPAGSGAGSAGSAWSGYLGTLGRTVRLMIERTSQRLSANEAAHPSRPSLRRGDVGVGDERGRLGKETRNEALDAPGSDLPTRLWFGPVAPNPSAGRVTFRIELPAAATVRIAILDISGRLVGEIRGQRAAGCHLLGWGAERAWPAGVYLARLEVDGRPAGVRRMVVLH